MSARTETDEFGAFVRRIVRAYRRRVAAQDIEGLAGLVALRGDLDEAIVAAVGELRRQDYSWTDVARVLGVTRQAAQQRYGR